MLRLYFCGAMLTVLSDIPSIVVESMPGTPPMSSRDIASAGYDLTQSPGSPTPMDLRYSSHADYSLTMDMPRLQRSSKRGSDLQQRLRGHLQIIVRYFHDIARQ